jgi:hypothetical protein
MFCENISNITKSSDSSKKSKTRHNQPRYCTKFATMAETAVATPPQSAIALCDERYNGRTLAGSDSSKNTYRNNYKSFLSWYVDNKDNAALALTTVVGEDGKPAYATQHNANMYFLHYVPTNIKGTRENAKRYLYAIEWFRANLELPLGEPIVESATVRLGLKKQQENCQAVAAVTYGGVDPHKGLRDIMSEEDNLKIVNYIWQHRPDYADLMFCYTWGRNAGVRGASARRFQMCDLNLSFGYGPEKVAPRNRTLLLVLRKGRRHKEKSTDDKQVGVQRHRDYRQCCVFATGILLIKLLRRQGNSIDFTQRNKKKDAKWWGLELCNFNKLNDQSTPMREVYSKTGVDSQCKVTHHRTQAVLIGGSNGLNDSQISSFTKHIQNKLHKSYIPDCEKTAMKVMAGFDKVSNSYYYYFYCNFCTIKYILIFCIG